MERYKRPNGSAQKGLLLTFTVEEHARVKAAGELAGPTLTEWARQLLLAAAEERLKAEGLTVGGTK